MECVAFSFLNNVGRRIIAIFQDDNVKIHQAQTVKEWFYELAPLSPDLKVFGICWRGLYRVLDSCIDQKMYAPLDGKIKI